MDVTTGVFISIPPHSTYYKNFDDATKDRITNWSPVLERLPTDFDDAISLRFSVGGALKLNLSGTVLGIASAEIGIALAVPTFTGTLKTFNDEEPCQDPSGKLGNSLEVEVGMAQKAYEVATLGGEVKAEQTFFSNAAYLFSTCIAANLDTQPTAASE